MSASIIPVSHFIWYKGGFGGWGEGEEFFELFYQCNFNFFPFLPISLEWPKKDIDLFKSMHVCVSVPERRRTARKLAGTDLCWPRILPNWWLRADWRCVKGETANYLPYRLPYSIGAAHCQGDIDHLLQPLLATELKFFFLQLTRILTASGVYCI